MTGARALQSFAVLALALGIAPAETKTLRPSFDSSNVGVAGIRAALEEGRVTSRELVDQYLERIEANDGKLRAILVVNPNARADAKRLDRERARGRIRGPLHGIPIVLKDNIDVAGGLPTTAGSLALLQNVPVRDAFVARKLIDAGALILGKANLSEWANIRSRWSTSGWSAVGGLTRNPHASDRSACGSSSGSGVAVAASFAAAAVGTETDGSITCPAAVTGVVGLKPTVGLVSRAGIIPISESQDTAGPMTRTVEDAAILLTAMAGSDSADGATTEADARRTDYTKGLHGPALKGARLGVLRFLTGASPPTDRLFELALQRLRAQGAVLVDIQTFDFGDLSAREQTVLFTEFKAGLNAYLAGAPAQVETRTLAELIAFNRTEPREMQWFGQDLFELAEATSGRDDPAYVLARDSARRLAGPEGLDRLLRENGVIALIAPTRGPAWTIDLVNGDRTGRSASMLPAIAGYPHLTVPMGRVGGLPLGLSFIGPAWSEQLLLSLGHAFEKSGPAAERTVVRGGR